MKKNRILLEVLILGGTIIPFIILYLIKGKAPFIEFDDHLKGTFLAVLFTYFYPLFIYQKNINRLPDNKSNKRFRIVWFIVNISFSVLYVSGQMLSLTSENYDKYFYILLGIFYMVDGNYQILLPKMGFNSFTHDEKVYKKVQRNLGRIEFFIGLVLVILCFVVPKNEVNLFITLNLILITGVIWIKITTK